MGWVSWPPYQSLDKAGKLVGLQAKLYRSIAQQADCQLTFLQGTWQAIQNGIKNGSIDLMGDATSTPARQEFAYFSAAYRREILALYVNNPPAPQFPQAPLEKLMENGFRTAITKDNYYGAVIDSLIKSPQFSENFVAFEHTHQSYQGLSKHQVDGLFDDPMVHAYTVRLLGFEKRFKRHQMIVQDESVSLMFSKKSVTPQIVQRFNLAISKVKKTAEYQRLWDWK